MSRQNLVGPQIRKLRYNRAWSQAKLAVELALEGLDVQREFVAQIEGQTHCVKDEHLPYFARVLAVSLPDLYPPFSPNKTIGETVGPLLEDRRNGHTLPIVTKPLQLPSNAGGKIANNMNATANTESVPAAPASTERLAYSLHETAEMLGIDYFSVYRLVQRGRLKACRALRGKFLIPRTEILRLLKTE